MASSSCGLPGSHAQLGRDPLEGPALAWNAGWNSMALSWEGLLAEKNVRVCILRGPWLQGGGWLGLGRGPR